MKNCEGTWWSAFSTGFGDKEGEQVDEVDIGLYRMVTVMMTIMMMVCAQNTYGTNTYRYSFRR